MTATFRIEQGATIGSWGRALKTVNPASISGDVTLRAQDVHLTYTWTVTAQPDGSLIVPVSAGVTAALPCEERGGYMVRLVVDAGLASEDVLELYLGVPLETSLLPIPAWNEVNQDNSENPFTGEKGWWPKLERWIKWADTTIASAGSNIPGGVYIDATNGSDVTGDGTMGKPYATIVYACTQQADPTTDMEFMIPVVFYVSPGLYTGTVTLPKRANIKFVMKTAQIVGDIDWPLDPTLWTTFSIPPAAVPPRLQFVSADHVPSPLELIPYPDFGSPWLSTGTLRAYNSNPGHGTPLAGAYVAIEGVYRSQFNILNAAAGTFDLDDIIGPLSVSLKYSACFPGESYIGGEAELNAGGTDIVAANEIVVYAEYSVLCMCAVCDIGIVRNCLAMVNRTIDRNGDPYAYGRIQGIASALLIGPPGFSQSMFLGGCYVGTDPLSAAPHAPANLIPFDDESLLALTGVSVMLGGVDLVDTFNGFGTGYMGAFSRGWALQTDLGACNSLRIPAYAAAMGLPGDIVSGLLFSHTYATAAGYFEPGGDALAADNRLVIQLEPGRYNFTNDLTLNAEDVDIEGCGSATVDVNGLPSLESTILYFSSAYTLTCSAAVARYEAFSIMKDTHGTPDLACLIMDNTKGAHNSGCVFKDITFLAGPNCGGENPLAVVIAPDPPPP